MTDLITHLNFMWRALATDTPAPWWFDRPMRRNRAHLLEAHYAFEATR